MKIYKYTLDLIELQSLELPIRAQILTLQIQGGLPQIWAIVDETAQRETRTFATYKTGNAVPDNLGKYIGTYQMMDGDLVFHVFEKV